MISDWYEVVTEVSVQYILWLLIWLSHNTLVQYCSSKWWLSKGMFGYWKLLSPSKLRLSNWKSLSTSIHIITEEFFTYWSCFHSRLCKRTLLWKVLKKKDMWQVFIHYQLFYFEKVHMGRRHPTPNPPDPSPKISVVQYTCGNDKKKLILYSYMCVTNQKFTNLAVHSWYQHLTQS